MFAEFKHTMRLLRGQIIGWSIGLGLYALMMASLFDSIKNIEGFEELIASYPPEIMAFFGDMMGITTPKGYLDIYYFSYMTIIFGIFAVGASARLLVGDEEKGILDLVMAHPISRTSLFWGRFLAFLSATVVVLVVAWLSWFLPSRGTELELTGIELLRPFIPVFVQIFLFGSLTVLLSMVLPSVRTTSMLAGGLLVGNYLLVGLANINDKLQSVVEFTPMHYYQGGRAVDGLNWEWLAGLTAVALLLVLLAWGRFIRRDIRVGGEGGWALPRFLRGAART